MVPRPIAVCLLAVAWVLASAAEEKKADDTGGVPANKSNEEAQKAFGELAKELQNEFHARFPNGRVVQIEHKESSNLLLAVAMWDIYKPNRSVELTVSDELNKKFKATYTLYGELVSTSEYKLSVERLPEKALAALKAWAPGATWAKPAEAQKKYRQPFGYKVEFKKDGKTYKAEVFDDGTFKKQDRVP